MKSLFQKKDTGLTVYLDDKKCGVTPLEVNVNQGDLFIVRIEKEGYIPLKSQKALIDEKYLEINQNLTKIKSIENAINAVYSVSPTNKVYFAKGNIQYHPATWTWRFAEHQWDVIGDANKNISEKYNGWIDLFSFRVDGDSGYHIIARFMERQQICIAKSQRRSKQIFRQYSLFDGLDHEAGSQWRGVSACCRHA